VRLGFVIAPGHQPIPVVFYLVKPIRPDRRLRSRGRLAWLDEAYGQRGSPANEGGLDRITSNSGRGVSAESRFEPTAMIGLPRPLAWAFSAATFAALGLMSSATTLAAPPAPTAIRIDTS
jgi:hypothetical protein